MTKNLIVYNASAGSGKTFVLAIEYIALCLNSNDDRFFRRILAITFTNKAAHELKERIIEFLAQISTSETEVTKVKELQKRTALSAKEIQTRAARIHESMLQNYGEINISTIDSFVLRILRSFSKELGMSFDFDLELDGSRVKDLLVESIMSQIGNDDFITEQLARSATQNLDDGKPWNPKRDMQEAIDHLLDEDSIPYRELLAAKGESKLQAALEVLRAKRNALWQEITEAQAIVREGMTARGLEISHFSGGSRGFITFAFKDFRTQTAPSDAQIQSVEDGKYSSPGAKKAGLTDIIDEFASTFVVPNFWKVVESIPEVNLLENLYRNRLSLVLALRLQVLLKKFEQEEGLSVIKDNNFKIAAIIDDNPTPFIYERIGERFQHFLIDEFQDTSLLQWRNMLPLIDNSLSYGNKNFLVGDVKQSIYRWRGGEADQMMELPKISGSEDSMVLRQIEETLSSNLLIKTLDENYRSSRAVVQFNNDLFRFLGSSIPKKYIESYANVAQGEQRTDTGYVELSVLEKGTELEASLEKMMSSIKQVEKDGYFGSDICILTRNNKHGRLISKYLETVGYSVSSPDSLLLNGHAEVQLLVNFLVLISSESTLGAELFITHRLLEKVNREDSFHQWALKCRNSGSSAERIQELCADIGYEWSPEKYTDKDAYHCLNVLCHDLGLDMYDAYIQELLNAALAYIQSKDSTLIGFCEHWKNKENSLAVKAGADRNSIQLMTIHKSKGLQFPVVMIPYLNWKSGRNTKTKEWAELRNETMDIGLFSINNSLADTPYEYLLTQEQEKTELDELNVLYVAFTRAEDRLYTQVIDPGQKGIAKSLISYVNSASKVENRLILGEESTRPREDETPPQSTHLREYETQARGDILSLALSKEESISASREMGQVLHSILEKSTDLKEASERLEFLLDTGTIDPEQELGLKDALKNVYAIEEQQGWSSEKYSVKKEVEVLSPDGKLFRMDKLLIDEDSKKLVVIDYKTGKEDQKHKKQMSGYVDLLKEMGWKSVEGYLLYTNSGHLEKL